jgi:hypothetical protein
VANYPGSLDAISNPDPTTGLAALSHAAQHTLVNDIIEAIEAKLGIGAASPAAGTVLKGGAGGSTLFGQIGTAEIANNAITSSQIADNTIVNGDLANGAVNLLKCGVGMVGMRFLTMGTNLSTNNTTITEMSTSYRISQAASKAGNYIILVGIINIIMPNVPSSLNLGWCRDGAYIGVGNCLFSPHFASAGVNAISYWNLCWGTIMQTFDANAHAYSPAWGAGSNTYTIQHNGGSVANGQFLLFECNS